ncbi:MAG: aldehyde ferredoxin oxidoreductase N-terminal domain-containing protein, partial [Bacillota bacterium]
MKPDTHPFDPESVLVFAPGSLTGSRVPCSGRHSVVGKSPLTGIWGEASVGGSWGSELKAAGLDGLIVVGRAGDPVYLYVRDGAVEFRDASGCWGKDCYQTDEALRAETDPSAAVCCIGPAGERMVRIAAIITD